MALVEVDFDVFKAITARRDTEQVSENDVLRELLGLPPARRAALDASLSESPSVAPAWAYKAVRFPIGTDLRARYQGRYVAASIQSDGIHVNGKVANSPSQAANFVTGNNVNGWTFWEARFPGQTQWRSIQGLRPG